MSKTLHKESVSQTKKKYDGQKKGDHRFSESAHKSLQSIASIEIPRASYVLAPIIDNLQRSSSRLTIGSTTRSSDGEKGAKQMIKYMNTYRLESKNPFRKEAVYNIIRDVFTAELEAMVYEPIIFSKACAVIASEIRNRVKALGFERYKLVCIVQVCEKNKQSVNSVAKFLWDPDRDNCASYSYENSYFLASGAVFGLYFE